MKDAGSYAWDEMKRWQTEAFRLREELEQAKAILAHKDTIIHNLLVDTDVDGEA